MKIGIDASNINDGGGITHLSQIIKNFNINQSTIDQIVIWGNKKSLSKIKNKKKIKKIILDSKYKNIFLRLFWQFFFFEKELKKLKCNRALILGGISFLKKFPSTIIMQNILPFDNNALKKYSYTFKLKCMIQKFLFVKSIKKANKVIFISKTSQKKILKEINLKKIDYKIITHGVSNAIFTRRNFKLGKQIKLLCVSKIDFYKNQLIILKAIKILIAQGFDIKLKLLGSSFKPALKEIKENILKLNLEKIVKIKDEISFKNIAKEYKNSNLHISPSFCESFGITLIEAGNYSVPCICSNTEIFNEITNKNAFFFDPFSEKDLANTIKMVIKNNQIRNRKNKAFYKFINKNYSWKKVAFQTFSYVQNDK
jgi:glycosyltransferase involved in cell wall biosynthesis